MEIFFLQRSNLVSIVWKVSSNRRLKSRVELRLLNKTRVALCSKIASLQLKQGKDLWLKLYSIFSLCQLQCSVSFLRKKFIDKYVEFRMILKSLVILKLEFTCNIVRAARISLRKKNESCAQAICLRL